MMKMKRRFIINLTKEVLKIGDEMHEQMHGFIPDDERYSLAYALSSMTPGEILEILEEEAE